MLAEPQSGCSVLPSEQSNQAHQAERERAETVDRVLDGIFGAFDRAFARAEGLMSGPIEPRLPCERKRDRDQAARRAMRSSIIHAIPTRGWVALGDAEYFHPVAPSVQMKRIGSDVWAWRKAGANSWAGRFPTRGEAFLAGHRELEAVDAR